MRDRECRRQTRRAARAHTRRAAQPGGRWHADKATTIKLDVFTHSSHNGYMVVASHLLTKAIYARLVVGSKEEDAAGGCAAVKYKTTLRQLLGRSQRYVTN